MNNIERFSPILAELVESVLDGVSRENKEFAEAVFSMVFTGGKIEGERVVKDDLTSKLRLAQCKHHGRMQ